MLVPEIAHEGQAVAVALEERAIAHRLVGEAAFFQRAEIRDVLAWLRLLADPTDAGAVVRALARPPIELRSVDIARCTQIARRRKLDMVAALAAATESPAGAARGARADPRVPQALPRRRWRRSTPRRPDLYVHRLIERLGLRRQQLFAAQADVVERLRALAGFGELAAAYVRRAPQATAARVRPLDRRGRRLRPARAGGARARSRPAAVQVLALEAAGGLEADHVYVLGLHAGLAARRRPSRSPTRCCASRCPPTTRTRRRAALAPGAVRRRQPRPRGGSCSPTRGRRPRRRAARPSPLLEAVRGAARRRAGRTSEEELFGPAEALHSTYRLLRDELLAGTTRAGGRLGELRFDTDLDVSHAVVRYLELLKLAALIARPEGQSVAESLRDVNARILQAVTAEQREIFSSSALDDYLLDAERDARRRAQAIAARDEPSLEPFLPRRGEGVVLSASDIDTYRTCPLKYKFARVFRIPQEPTLHQRFGILVHQVLERFHARAMPRRHAARAAGAARRGLAARRLRRLRGGAPAARARRPPR